MQTGKMGKKSFDDKKCVCTLKWYMSMSPINRFCSVFVNEAKRNGAETVIIRKVNASHVLILTGGVFTSESFRDILQQMMRDASRSKRRAPRYMIRVESLRGNFLVRKVEITGPPLEITSLFSRPGSGGNRDLF